VSHTVEPLDPAVLEGMSEVIERRRALLPPEEED
jgi:hypothetical protein